LKTILFLCTGNYYRSRFAEIFFNHHAEQRGLHWRAFSRGLALDPFNPGPISRYTIERLVSHGILFDKHRFPLDVTRQDFDAAHHVVAVKEDEHRPLMHSRFPTILNRVEFWQVHDVDCAGPDVAMPHLEREVIGLMERLAGEDGR
jgi:protein-tyrosine phosphatase